MQPLASKSTKTHKYHIRAGDKNTVEIVSFSEVITLATELAAAWWFLYILTSSPLFHAAKGFYICSVFSRSPFQFQSPSSPHIRGRFSRHTFPHSKTNAAFGGCEPVKSITLNSGQTMMSRLWHTVVLCTAKWLNSKREVTYRESLWRDVRPRLVLHGRHWGNWD